MIKPFFKRGKYLSQCNITQIHSCLITTFLFLWISSEILFNFLFSNLLQFYLVTLDKHKKTNKFLIHIIMQENILQTPKTERYIIQFSPSILVFSYGISTIINSINQKAFHRTHCLNIYIETLKYMQPNMHDTF